MSVFFFFYVPTNSVYLYVIEFKLLSLEINFHFNVVEYYYTQRVIKFSYRFNIAHSGAEHTVDYIFW